ncbi:MAG: VanZ family protein [Deltaproteobacteria bacterium]|nr:VanZ family protein [Deltaproteobacteria bacterium]
MSARWRAAGWPAWAALGWAALIHLMSSAPRQLPAFLDVDGLDKLIHLVEFGTLGGLLTAALWRGVPELAGAGAWVAALGAAAYGCVDELHQAYVPGRSSSFYDVVADAVGALAAALLVRRVLQRRAR